MKFTAPDCSQSPTTPSDLIKTTSDYPDYKSSIFPNDWVTVAILFVGLSLGCVAEPKPVIGNGTKPSEAPEGISPSAAAGIADLDKEKATRTRAQEKLDTQIVLALKKSRREAPFDKPNELQVHVPIDAEGRVLVDINGIVSAGLLKSIESFGGKVINNYPAFGTIRALVPLNSLEILATRPDVKSCRLATTAKTH